MSSLTSLPPATAPVIDPALFEEGAGSNVDSNGVDGSKTGDATGNGSGGSGAALAGILPTFREPRKVRRMTDLTLAVPDHDTEESKGKDAEKDTKPLDDEMRSQIRHIYTQLYASGIDSFLDTDWYSSIGIDLLERDEKLMRSFGDMLSSFAETKGYDAMRLLPGTEGRMIWSLMSLARSVQGDAADAKVKNVKAKLIAVENLVTGLVAESDPFIDDESMRAEQDPVASTFWKSIGSFVSPSAQTDSTVVAHALEGMRGSLAGRENRDVMYSMAIMRDTLRRYPTLLTPTHNRTAATWILNLPEDERLDFSVAKKFVEDEAAGSGTTQVVQRLCGMAVRGWTMMRQ